MESPEEVTTVHAAVCEPISSVKVADLQEETEEKSELELSELFPPVTDISFIEGSGGGIGNEKNERFKYANPGGTFYTGIDVTSEVNND